VSAVASDQPIRQHGLLAPVGVPQPCFDTVVGALKCGELYLALDGNAEIVESLFEQALGLGLWEHQRVGIGALHAAHVDAAYDLVACDEVDRLGFEPGVDERGRSAAPVQQFQGSAPQNESLGLVGPLCRPVDDADSPTVAHKPRGHCHSDWAGADD
jgi:hypothetical protein